jgi:hypothetical protein
MPKKICRQVATNDHGGGTTEGKTVVPSTVAHSPANIKHETVQEAVARLFPWLGAELDRGDFWRATNEKG